MLKEVFKKPKQRVSPPEKPDGKTLTLQRLKKLFPIPNKKTVNKFLLPLLGGTFDFIKLYISRGLNVIQTKYDLLYEQHMSRVFSSEISESKINKNPVQFLKAYKRHKKNKKKFFQRPSPPSEYSSDSSDETSEDERIRRIVSSRDQQQQEGFQNIFSSERLKECANAWVRFDRSLAHWSINELNRQQAEVVRARLNDNKMTRAFITRENITSVALTSRVILFVLQFFVTNLFSYAKHTNDGYKFTPEVGYGTEADKLVNATFGGLANWDGQYFLHIAVHGYTEENFLAFFPLFPMIVSGCSSLLYFFLGGMVSFSSIILIVGWFFNVICFVKTAHTLYEITKQIDKENQQESNLGAAAVLLFCFNPASVFFSSLYTESLFAFLTAKSVLAAYERNILYSALWAGLSSVCRSNGLLNFGFVMAAVAQDSMTCNRWKLNYIILDLARPFVLTIMSLLPFLAFQVYGVYKFCVKQMQGNEPLPPYCTYKTFPYTYVQQKYWNVGFLRYYEVKQLPNFILAAPILYLVVRENWKRLRVLVARSIALLSPKDIFKIYVLSHGLFLAVFCFMNVHVQVSTRLILAAFPHFYVYLAESCRDETLSFRNRTIPWPIISSLVQFWFIAYFILGGIAFPLDYPWT